MQVSAIVAAAKNRVIGANGDIPWYLPADLKYFKKVTTGHPVIMGRRTFDSIGRPLPNRTNIVLSKNAYFTATGIVTARSIQEALEIAYDTGAQEAFIIGGGGIYEATQKIWDKIYYTLVDIQPEGDTYFPELDLSKWELVWAEQHSPDEKNEFAYEFRRYERIEFDENCE